MEERTKKAFDFAQQSTKQLLTLATGVIALTITFTKDFIGSAPDGTKWLVLAAWLSFLISVLFGTWTLFAMTGSLHPKQPPGPGEDDKAPSIWGKNVTVPSAVQILTFVVGLALTVAFGFAAT